MSRALCLAGFVVACAAAPPPAAEPIAPATESPTADSKPAPDPGASDVAAPELPGAPPPTDVGWDFHAWSYARELTVTLTSDGCEPAKLGDKPDDTVWCAHHAESKEGAVLFSRALYVARNKRLVKLAELPIAAGVVDNSEQPKDEKDRQVVRLDLVARSDGKQVEAREAPGFDCTKALKENADNRDVARELTGALDERIRKVCATRGDWRWTAGTLRRGPAK
jgi:hypothetical protein